MKVVVTGAAGMMSLSTLLYLLEQKDVTQIMAVDIEERKLKERVAMLGDKRLVAKTVDILDVKSSAEAFKGNDVVVNCTYQGRPLDMEYPDFELLSTKAALEAGVNWMGLGGAPPSPEHLDPLLDEEFRKKAILAILGMGGGTGLVQVMAAYAISKLDRTQCVDMFLGNKDLVPAEEHSRPLHPKYTMGGVRSMYSQDSFVYENGKLLRYPPRSNIGTFTFKEPLGTLLLATGGGGAVPSLAISFPEIKHIDFKLDLEPKIKFLADLGLFSQESINIKDVKVSPWSLLQVLLDRLPPETKKPPEVHTELRVITKGEKGGHKVEYDLMVRATPDADRKYLGKGCSASYRTGICIAIAAVMVGRGLVKKRGVLPPELCIPPEIFLNELSKEGFEVEAVRKESL